MTYKVHTSQHFTLQLKINIMEELQTIEVLVILTNHMTHKKDMKCFKASEYGEALKQYDRWEKFFFTEEQNNA